MPETKGLRATIYYNPEYRSCANGGISQRFEEVVVVGTIDRRADPGNSEVTPLPDGSRVFEPREDAPAVVLVYRRMGSQTLVHAEPLDGPGPGGDAARTPYMSGGSFVSSCDSRFRALVGFYGAVSLHDRTETWAQYDALSR